MVTSFLLSVLPPHAPFSDEDIQRLDTLLARSSVAQRAWLSGFLAGFDFRSGETDGKSGDSAPATVAAPISLMVLYASESGNAEKLAASLAKQARKKGFRAQLTDMADLEPGDIAGAGALAVIAATWGEGEPPSRAARAYHALMANDAPRLDGVPFAVLALGDSAYPDFCATGAALDSRLEALGGHRVMERVDCDLDFALPAKEWADAVLQALKPADGSSFSIGATLEAVSPETAFAADLDGSATVEARVQAHVNLNSSRSEKETVHLELEFDNVPAYEPGDALEIFVRNDPALACEVAAAAGLSGEAELVEQLEAGRDITTLSVKTLAVYAGMIGNEELAALAASPDARMWVRGRQLIDLLAAYPAALLPDQLLSLTRLLAPRSYSIASSLRETPNEAHLLVAAVRYDSHGRRRHGVASTYVADRLRRGGNLTVRLKPNRHFRLPETDRDIIMVGPGTGVAPFRSFVQERRALGASGRNWLFFGDRTSSHDFLYQLEWQDALADGSLAALDVAFSRDAPEKVYVQDRLWQRRRRLVEWLENGACFYVCGDASRMAKDVRAALVRIAADVKALSEDKAQTWIGELERERRYLLDVY